MPTHEPHTADPGRAARQGVTSHEAAVKKTAYTGGCYAIAGCEVAP
jgi:hypothetical protein